MKVLLIDDHPLILMALQSVIQGLDADFHPGGTELQHPLNFLFAAEIGSGLDTEPDTAAGGGLIQFLCPFQCIGGNTVQCIETGFYKLVKPLSICWVL